MWDVTSMGVRGLAPWSWSIFEITSCQISNWKHFSLKMWDFTTMGVRGLAPWSWSILKSTSCQISDLKYFSLKNLALSLIFLFPSPHFSFPSENLPQHIFFPFSFLFPSPNFSRCWGRFQGITLLKTFPSTFENMFFPSLCIFFLPLTLFSSLPFIFQGAGEGFQDITWHCWKPSPGPFKIFSSLPFAHLFSSPLPLFSSPLPSFLPFPLKVLGKVFKT